MNRLFVSTVLALPLALSFACSSDPKGDDPVVVTDPAALAAPAQGQGFQFKTELFQVNAGEEMQSCYFFKVSDLAKSGGLPATEAVNLHRVELVQKSGSHHMNLFRVRTVAGLDPTKGTVVGLDGQGECFKSSNWSDWPLVANTQLQGNLDWTFPDGVANVFQQDEWLMLQTHYVNATSQKTPEGGQVAVNFHTIPKSEVKAELGTIFATKQSIRICKSNPTPTFTGTCNVGSKEPVHIIGANGHFHSRGKKFDMFAWDGQSIDPPADDKRFYESKAWDEPPMLRSPDLDVTVQPGSGVMYTCSYQWTPPTDEAGGCEKLDAIDKSKDPNAQLDCCYRFGPIVEANEHCNAFVYYWPKQDDISCR